MSQLVNFEELIKNEDVIHIRNGHAYKVLDGETTIWKVFDGETDEIYLLVDDEVNDLQYELDLDFYQMVATIKNHKTYNWESRPVLDFFILSGLHPSPPLTLYVK